VWGRAHSRLSLTGNSTSAPFLRGIRVNERYPRYLDGVCAARGICTMRMGVQLKSAAKSRGSLSKQRYITRWIESHPSRRLASGGVYVVASGK